MPHLHDPAGGTLVPVDRLADALLDPAYPRDGVPILSGEPFQQPAGLLALVRALRDRGCRHIPAHTGYAHERLRCAASQRSAIGALVDEVDALIDGPARRSARRPDGPVGRTSRERVTELWR